VAKFAERRYEPITIALRQRAQTIDAWHCTNERVCPPQRGLRQSFFVAVKRDFRRLITTGE